MTLCYKAQSSLDWSGRIYGLEELKRVQRQSDIKEYVNSIVFSWCTQDICMDNEDEEQGLEYDVRAHVNGMLALRQMYGR